MLARSNVRYLIILAGINDIGYRARDHRPYGDLEVDLEWGLSQVVAQAHQEGIQVFGATLLPPCQPCIGAAGEAVRQTLIIGFEPRKSLMGSLILTAQFKTLNTHPDSGPNLIPGIKSTLMTRDIRRWRMLSICNFF